MTPRPQTEGGMSEEEIEKCRTARYLLEPPAPEVCGRLLATIDSLRERLAVAEGELTAQRHADEKHILSQSPVEFLRSRNRKRPCDSDGFIACERCLTMLVCGDYEDAALKAKSAEEALEKIVSHVEASPIVNAGMHSLAEIARAALKEVR